MSICIRDKCRGVLFMKCRDTITCGSSSRLTGAATGQCVLSGLDRIPPAARERRLLAGPAGNQSSGTASWLRRRGARMSPCSRDTRVTAHVCSKGNDDSDGRFGWVTHERDVNGLTHVPVLLRPPDFLTPSVSCLNGDPPHRVSRLVMMRPRKAVVNELWSASGYKSPFTSPEKS